MGWPSGAVKWRFTATILTGFATKGREGSIRLQERKLKTAILPVDGIGQEIGAEAARVLNALDLSLEIDTALLGYTAYADHGLPCGRRFAPDGPFVGTQQAFDALRCSRPEIERIAGIACRWVCGKPRLSGLGRQCSHLTRARPARTYLSHGD